MAHALLGGWRLNASAMVQTGLPFNLGLNNSANTNSAGGSRPDRSGSGVLPSDRRSLQRWFDDSAFAQPAKGYFGNAARNVLYGPGRVNFDASLFKDFGFTSIETAVPLGVFQRVQHAAIRAAQRDDLNPGVGQITSTVGNPRQIQLALRLLF